MSALAQTLHESQLAQAVPSASVRTGSVVQLAQVGGFAAGAKAVVATALGTFLGGLGSDAAGLLIFYWIFSTLVEIFSKIVNELLVWSLRTFILLTGYNDFLNNEFVNSGWATLRDIANLFFVVILLVIAFATVLNISSYEYQQLLPKFILAIFLVNFSRTIVGLMIDASQVVMVTFASAFYQSAAGNFIRLLRIDQWLQVKSLVSNAITSAGGATGSGAIEALSAAVSGVDIVSNFVALLFTMAVATFALGVGLTLVAVIVYRIVALWLLIIFSPLAFLAWILPSTQSYFSQWFGTLVKQLTVGPLLVFVVWLALSTVQQNPQSYALIENSQSITQIMSSLGMTDAYGTEDDNSALNAGLNQGVGDNQIASTAISSWNNLTAFVVAITVLIAGIKFASSMSGGAGAFAERLAGFARKPVDIGAQKGKSLGGWAAKNALSEPVKESAWYLRNKKVAKKTPVLGRFFKSSDERIKDSEFHNMKWYAANKGIIDLGAGGRIGMNQGEDARADYLKKLNYQDSQELLEDTEATFKKKYGVYSENIVLENGKQVKKKEYAGRIQGPTINPNGKNSIALTGDAMELRARRDLFKKMAEEEHKKKIIVGENGTDKDNIDAKRKQALKESMEKFDKKFGVEEHDPENGVADMRAPNVAGKISGHLVGEEYINATAGVQSGASNRPQPPTNQNPQGGGATARAIPGSGSSYGPSSSSIPPGSPLAGSSTRDARQPQAAQQQGAATVNVAQNTQSSTTVNMNATVNAQVSGAAPATDAARRPTRLRAANSPAGVSLSEAKAAAEAKERDAQGAKAATRAAGARARKADTAAATGASSVPSGATNAPSLRQDSGATGQKAAEAARNKSEAAAPSIVVEAAQNAEIAREVESRLRSLEATASAQGVVSENRGNQVDELAKQLTDLSKGKPAVVRQLIQSNPDVRKIVAGIVKNPIEMAKLMRKIEAGIKKNPELQGLDDAEVREISREQTKVALRALKKEDKEAVESMSYKPGLSDVSREVLDEDDESSEESGVEQSGPPSDTTPNA